MQNYDVWQADYHASPTVYIGILWTNAYSLCLCPLTIIVYAQICTPYRHGLCPVTDHPQAHKALALGPGHFGAPNCQIL